MSKSNVNPNYYKVAGRERQGGDIAQARNKRKHAESVARRRTGIGATSQTPAPREDAASPEVAPPGAAKTWAPVRRPTGALPQITKKLATKAVAGAFGKEPSPRRRATRKG